MNEPTSAFGVIHKAVHLQQETVHGKTRSKSPTLASPGAAHGKAAKLPGALRLITHKKGKTPPKKGTK